MTVSQPPGWYGEPNAWRIGSGSLQNGLAWALDYLARRGVKIPSTGRYRKALNTLKTWNQAPPPFRLSAASSEDFRLIQVAHRTAWETLVIACAAWRQRRKRRSPFTRNKFNKMMKGGDFPSSTKTEPWDIQFELFAAAMLVHGGLEVMDGEPDIRFLYGYETVGVAAKRLTSLASAQLEHHVDYAVRQIGRTPLRGWVALNLDTRFGSLVLEEDREKMIREFTAVFDSTGPALRDHFQDKKVLGVMLYGYLSAWVEPPDLKKNAHLSFSTPFRWHAWVDDAAQRLLYDNVSDGWRERVNRQLRTIANGRCE